MGPTDLPQVHTAVDYSLIALFMRADLIVTGTPPASPRQQGASEHHTASVWISRSSELARTPYRTRKSKLIF